jgi:hypothetical protein
MSAWSLMCVVLCADVQVLCERPKHTHVHAPQEDYC